MQVAPFRKHCRMRSIHMRIRMVTLYAIVEVVIIVLPTQSIVLRGFLGQHKSNGELTNYLNSSLWMGIKELYNGLKQQNFRCVYNTVDMVKQRDELINELQTSRGNKIAGNIGIANIRAGRCINRLRFAILLLFFMTNFFRHLFLILSF